jgi:hypothetical protein
MSPSAELQASPPPADDQGMTKLLISFFRRAPRRRIALLHGPRHA